MLYRAAAPQEGYCLELACSRFWPPSRSLAPPAYRDWLRAAYARHPAPFIALARRAHGGALTLTSSTRFDLVEVLYAALVAVAAAHGWAIDGGVRGQPRARTAGGDHYANPRRCGAPQIQVRCSAFQKILSERLRKFSGSGGRSASARMVEISPPRLRIARQRMRSSSPPSARRTFGGAAG